MKTGGEYLPSRPNPITMLFISCSWLLNHTSRKSEAVTSRKFVFSLSPLGLMFPFRSTGFSSPQTKYGGSYCVPDPESRCRRLNPVPKFQFVRPRCFELFAVPGSLPICLKKEEGSKGAAPYIPAVLPHDWQTQPEGCWVL